MASDVEERLLLDNETGELHQTVICLRSSSLTCQDYNKPISSSTFEEDRSRFRIPQSEHAASRKPKVQREVQINGIDLTVLNSNTLLSVACVLPPVLLFPAWATIMFVFSEASIHIWSHRRNREKSENEAVFRSPFNLISSEFCAKCRTEKWMKQISKIQDKRSLRRNLIDPSYIKQVVR